MILKQETSGGRKPNIYGLNPESGYFIGVDAQRLNQYCCGRRRKIYPVEDEVPFYFENTPAALENLYYHRRIYWFVEGFTIRFFSVGINITGRKPYIRLYSYSFFYFEENFLP